MKERIGVLLLAAAIFAPSIASAVGPSPAKRGSAILKKKGWVVDRAVTVYRSPSNKVGVARIKLINGQVFHVLLNLKRNRIIKAKDLTAVANQHIALRAPSKGWKAGYVVEGDSMGMRDSMTARGNVNRSVIDWNNGYEAPATAIFTPQGRLKKLTIAPPN